MVYIGEDYRAGPPPRLLAARTFAVNRHGPHRQPALAPTCEAAPGATACAYARLNTSTNFTPTPTLGTSNATGGLFTTLYSLDHLLAGGA